MFEESINNVIKLLPEIWVALGQTMTMLGIGLTAAILIGGPLGILLFLVSEGQSLENRPLSMILGWLVKIGRAHV